MNNNYGRNTSFFQDFNLIADQSAETILIFRPKWLENHTPPGGQNKNQKHIQTKITLFYSLEAVHDHYKNNDCIF